MFLPLQVDVPLRRLPWMNWVIIAVTIICFPLTVQWNGEFKPLGERWFLGSGYHYCVITHLFMHGNILHLLGNVYFLFLFGNAVCAKLGNFQYLVVYLGLGVCSSVDYLMSKQPAIGASGAIMGVVGMFVVWYFNNTISCLWVFWNFGDIEEVDAKWVVLIYLVFDLYGLMRHKEGDNVGYLAHIFGLAFGFCLAIILLKLKVVGMEEGEQSLLDVTRGAPAKPRKKRRKKRSQTHAIPEFDPSQINKKSDSGGTITSGW